MPRSEKKWTDDMPPTVWKPSVKLETEARELEHKSKDQYFGPAMREDYAAAVRFYRFASQVMATLGL